MTSIRPWAARVDNPAITKVYPWFKLRPDCVVEDTMVWARLIWPHIKQIDVSWMKSGKLPADFAKQKLGLARGTTKNDKPRDVPCTARVLAMIPELNERATGGRWFPWPLGSSGPLYLLQNIRDDMKKRGFDFDDVKLHTFRHTCATRLAEGGMDLVSLRDWLGHSDIKITAQRYIHLMNGHIYRGAGILDAYSPGTIEAVGGNDDEDGENISFQNNQANGRECAGNVTVGTC